MRKKNLYKTKHTSGLLVYEKGNPSTKYEEGILTLDQAVK